MHRMRYEPRQWKPLNAIRMRSVVHRCVTNSGMLCWNRLPHTLRWARYRFRTLRTDNWRCDALLWRNDVIEIGARTRTSVKHVEGPWQIRHIYRFADFCQTIKKQQVKESTESTHRAHRAHTHIKQWVNNNMGTKSHLNSRKWACRWIGRQGNDATKHWVRHPMRASRSVCRGRGIYPKEMARWMGKMCSRKKYKLLQPSVKQRTKATYKTRRSMKTGNH